VMTGDFVIDALDRGWLPARTVVLVGDGRLARGIGDRMVAAGIRVAEQVPVSADDAADRRTVPVRALRGERRLEAVQVGDRWVAADGLVLAHALRPATFLIRGLGIGDDRPGVPMPVEDGGALPLPGLHAAGTCVRPAVDHEASLSAGAAVVRAVRSSLEARRADASAVTIDGGTRR
jgi:hypothetical protein